MLPEAVYYVILALARDLLQVFRITGIVPSLRPLPLELADILKRPRHVCKQVTVEGDFHLLVRGLGTEKLEVGQLLPAWPDTVQRVFRMVEVPAQLQFGLYLGGTLEHGVELFLVERNTAHGVERVLCAPVSHSECYVLCGHEGFRGHFLDFSLYYNKVRFLGHGFHVSHYQPCELSEKVDVGGAVVKDCILVHVETEPGKDKLPCRGLHLVVDFDVFLGKKAVMIFYGKQGLVAFLDDALDSACCGLGLRLFLLELLYGFLFFGGHALLLAERRLEPVYAFGPVLQRICKLSVRPPVVGIR